MTTTTKVALGVAAVVLAAILAFGVFGVHTLFIDETVDEANPFAATETETSTEPDQLAAVPTEPPKPDNESTAAATDEDSPADEPDVPATNEDELAEPTPAPESVEPTPTPGIVTVSQGTFVDGDHPTSGTAVSLTNGQQTFLRFEGFATDNGPDLNVYLRSSGDPSDFLDLGDLKGNIGDQNYELPAGIDLDRYDFVDIWCVRFGVSFGTAALSAP